MMSTRCKIEIRDQEMEAIVDSGVATNIMTKGLQEKLGINITESSNGRFRLADGKKVIALGQIFITIKIGEIMIPMRVQIIDSREKHLIMGTEILAKVKGKIDFEKGKLEIEYEEEKVETPIFFSKEKVEIKNEEFEDDWKEEYEEKEQELEEENVEELEVENFEYEEEWEEFEENPAYYLAQLT